MGDTAELASIIANNAGASKQKLLDLNKNFSTIKDFRRKLSTITTKSKGIEKASTLKNIRKSSQESELDILENFIEFAKDDFPKLGNILKEIDNFNKFESIGKFGRRFVSPSNIVRGGIIGALGASRRRGGGGGGFESGSSQ